jgi:arylsulfatase A
VPLLAAGAGVVGKGRDCEVPVNSADLPLTIAKLTGVALASGVDGQEITPLLGNSGGLPGRPMYFHYPHYYETTTPVSAVMHGDWKLLHYYEDDRQELYNLQTDPAETKDLAGQEKARKQQMLEQLKKWLASVKAQYPTKP